MSGAPYYKRYPSDFLIATMMLTAEQKGAYNVLLDLMYQAGGPIDERDRHYLARMIGCTLQRWSKLRQELIDIGKISVTEDGKLSNGRMIREMLRQQEAMSAARAKAAEGGRKAQQNRRENMPLSASRIEQNQRPEVDLTSSLPESVDTIEETPWVLRTEPRGINDVAQATLERATIKAENPAENLQKTCEVSGSVLATKVNEINDPAQVRLRDSESQSKKERALLRSDEQPAAPPVVVADARRELFGEGLTILRALTGKPEGGARALLGRFCKTTGDDCARVLAALRNAADHRPADPVPFIMGSLAPRQKRSGYEQRREAIGYSLLFPVDEDDDAPMAIEPPPPTLRIVGGRP